MTRVFYISLGALWFTLCFLLAFRMTTISRPRPGGVVVIPRAVPVPEAAPAAAPPAPAAAVPPPAPIAAPVPAPFAPAAAPVASAPLSGFYAAPAAAPPVRPAAPVPTSSVAGLREATRVQCRGVTRKGTQCRRKTTKPSGLCYQHEGQPAEPTAAIPAAPVSNGYLPAAAAPAAAASSSVQCSGTTKKGARCRRKTRDPSGYCPQHRPG